MEHTVGTSVRINASAEKVWQILDDFGDVDQFSIGVKRSPIIGDKTSGLGAKRHCVFYDDSSLVEEIIEYEAHKRLKVSLDEPPKPMKAMCAGFVVTSINETQCEVAMHMDFVMKLGPLGALVGLVMMRPVMRGVQKKLLTGLAYYAVTGKALDNTLPPRVELEKAFAA